MKSIRHNFSAFSVFQGFQQTHTMKSNKSLQEQQCKATATAICTIAAKSGKSQIVVALLELNEVELDKSQSSYLVRNSRPLVGVNESQSSQKSQLVISVTQMTPTAFSVGQNLRENSELCGEFSKLNSSLRAKRLTPVDAWIQRWTEKQQQLQQQISRNFEQNFSRKIESSQQQQQWRQQNANRRVEKLRAQMLANVTNCWRGLLSQLNFRAQLLSNSRALYAAEARACQSIAKVSAHVRSVTTEFNSLVRVSQRLAYFSQACQRTNAALKTITKLLALCEQQYEQAKVAQLDAIASVRRLAESLSPMAQIDELEARDLIEFFNGFLENALESRLSLSVELDALKKRVNTALRDCERQSVGNEELETCAGILKTPTSSLNRQTLTNQRNVQIVETRSSQQRIEPLINTPVSNIEPQYQQQQHATNFQSLKKNSHNLTRNNPYAWQQSNKYLEDRNYNELKVDEAAVREKLTQTRTRQRMSNATTTPTLVASQRELTSVASLRLIEDWLNSKVDELNGNEMSSLGSDAGDARELLARHEQVQLECRAIDDSIGAFKLKALATAANGKPGSISPAPAAEAEVERAREEQRLLAAKSAQVLRALAARIALLRRTIEFFTRAHSTRPELEALAAKLKNAASLCQNKVRADSTGGSNGHNDASADNAGESNDFETANSIQLVQQVSRELEARDVCAIVASGATIVSELQQLQLASRCELPSSVRMQLTADSVRSLVDSLNSQLVSLRSLLKQKTQRLNSREDKSQLSASYLRGCQQLSRWLNSTAIGELLSCTNNGKLGDNARQVRETVAKYSRLSIELHARGAELEAQLRSLPTLTKLVASNNEKLLLESESDALRAQWIAVSACVNARLDIAEKYLAILDSMAQFRTQVEKLESLPTVASQEANKLQQANSSSRAHLVSSINQIVTQLSNQVRNFAKDLNNANTQLKLPTNHNQIDDSQNKYSDSSSSSHNSHQTNKNYQISDIDKETLAQRANSLLQVLSRRQNATNNNHQLLASTSNSINYGTDCNHNINNVQQTKHQGISNSNVEPATLSTQNIRLAPPKFVKPLPSNLEVQPFGCVTLDCELSSPACTVEWLLNDSQRSIDSLSHRLVASGKRHSLTIDHFNPRASGKITVLAKNEFGATKSDCFLTLRSLSPKLYSPLDQEARQQQTGTIGSSDVNQRVPQILMNSTSSSWCQQSEIKNINPNQTSVDNLSGKKSYDEKQSTNRFSNFQLIDADSHDKSVNDSTTPKYCSTNFNNRPDSSLSRLSATYFSRNDNYRVSPAPSVARSVTLTRRTESRASSTNGQHSGVQMNAVNPFSSISKETPTLHGNKLRNETIRASSTTPNFQATANNNGLVCVLINTPPPTTIEWYHNDVPMASTTTDQDQQQYIKDTGYQNIDLSKLMSSEENQRQLSIERVVIETEDAEPNLPASITISQ